MVKRKGTVLHVSWQKRPSGMIEAEVCVGAGKETGRCERGLGKNPTTALARALRATATRLERSRGKVRE